jgi:hypothetical protein
MRIGKRMQGRSQNCLNRTQRFTSLQSAHEEIGMTENVEVVPTRARLGLESAVPCSEASCSRGCRSSGKKACKENR